MTHVSYSELRRNLAEFMNKVCDDRDTLLVTRQGARSVVMLSEEDYEGLLETVHLLRSPANAARLLQSIQQAEANKFIEHEPIKPESSASDA